jgi:hypothetical protein
MALVCWRSTVGNDFEHENDLASGPQPDGLPYICRAAGVHTRPLSHSSSLAFFLPLSFFVGVC